MRETAREHHSRGRAGRVGEVLLPRDPFRAEDQARAVAGTAGLLARKVLCAAALLAAVLLLPAPPVAGAQTAVCNQTFGAPGAFPNDADRDHKQIEDALKAAAPAATAGPNCINTVALSAGTYLIGAEIEVPSYVRLQGVGRSGSQHTRLQVWENSLGDGASNVIRINNVSHVTVKDLHIDGNAHNLWQADPHYGIIMEGARNSRITGIEISDLGYRGPEERQDNSGEHISLYAYDLDDPETPEDDGEYTQRSPEGVHSENNRIEGNVFDDSEFRAKFGVRALTNFELPKQDNAYNTFVRNNTIRGNTFRGFYWNSIEIGGPGTRYNTVEYNTFFDTKVSPIDGDKGAKHNTFQYNTANQIYAGATFAAGIRDQGFPRQCIENRYTPDLDDEYTVPQRYSEYNQYKHNDISHIRGAGASTGEAHGASLAWAKNAYLADNEFWDITGKAGEIVNGITEHDYPYATSVNNRATRNTWDGRTVDILAIPKTVQPGEGEGCGGPNLAEQADGGYVDPDPWPSELP